MIALQSYPTIDSLEQHCTHASSFFLICLQTEAYWANLFRYILQGFCTNELVGRVYSIDLSVGLNSSMNNTAGVFDNATSVVGFAPGMNSTTPMARQSANLLSLTSESGGGINQFIEQNRVTSLVSCLTENECLESPLFPKTAAWWHRQNPRVRHAND